MFCKDCGKELKNGEICRCASPVPEEAPDLFCGECGKRLPPGEKCDCTAPAPEYPEISFCAYCGKRLCAGERCDCPDASIPTGYCSICGNPLYNNESCSCTHEDECSESPVVETTIEEPAEVITAPMRTSTTTASSYDDNSEFFMKANDID